VNLLPPVTLLDLFVSVPLEGDQAPSPFQELMSSLEDLPEPAPPAQPLVETETSEIVLFLELAQVQIPELPVQDAGPDAAAELGHELERVAAFLAQPLAEVTPPPVAPGPPSAPQTPQIVPDLPQRAIVQASQEAPSPGARTTPEVQSAPEVQAAELQAPSEAPMPEAGVEVISSRHVFEAASRPGVTGPPPHRQEVAPDSPEDEAPEPLLSQDDPESPPLQARAPRAARPLAPTLARGPSADAGAPLEVEPEPGPGEPPSAQESAEVQPELNDLESLHELSAPAPREVQLKLDDDLELTVRRDGENIEVTLDGTPEALEPLNEIGPELRDELARSGFELSDFQQRERSRQAHEGGRERREQARQGDPERSGPSKQAPRRARRSRGLVDLTA
jgi:hypothetical protein